MKTYFALLLVCIFISGCAQVAPTSDTVQVNVSSVDSSSDSTSITLAQLKEHSQSGDCWVSYEGVVYDITEWLPLHPGGSAVIAQYCGTSSEFETAFSGKHGQKMVGQLQAQGRVVGTLN
jgi:cytochrome b involved in lipid metabolism